MAIVVGVSSCESGVFDHPGGDTPTDRTTTTHPDGTRTGSGETTTGGNDNGGTRYGWFLPEGPDSPSFPEDDVYRPLKSRACAEARTTLENEWRSMTAPRNVVLYQAAVHVCAGELADGRAMFARASRRGWAMDYGPDGAGEVDCAVYRAVRSVLEQQAPGTFACTGGRPPAWPAGPDRADPRTDTTTTTTTTGPATTTTTS
ncbi:hypothetical protein AB0425_35070 [Actinosynnema sp. NPDC051121]